MSPDLVAAHRVLASGTRAIRLGAGCLQHVARGMVPRAIGTTGSAVPCAMKIGTPALAAWRSACEDVRERQIGRQRDQAGERLGWRRPVCSVIAPPCEKPASTMRARGVPRSTSRAISASTGAVRGADAALVLAAHEVGAEDVVPGRA